jgi:hypothetical protein
MEYYPLSILVIHDVKVMVAGRSVTESKHEKSYLYYYSFNFIINIIYFICKCKESISIIGKIPNQITVIKNGINI